MAIVSIEKLSKRYDGGTDAAVKEMSLTVAEGEFMVLLGPSGCGKSSVLRMIAGLEPITAGTISIDNQVVNHVPAKDRDIAMVFQSYALYPHMDVYNNLAFGLWKRGVAREEIESRVQGAAAKLGLALLLGRKPHALSGGQRQRVALGRAIVREPKVFLFDEPLSNLDAALRVTTRNELIKQQHELGTTTIYVTHDQVEAMTMGDRVCIMNKGEVVQVGRPLEVYRNPADTFVARFLGNPQMNLLPGSLEVEGQRARLHLAGNSFELSSRVASALSNCVGRAVIVGVRPEDLYDTPPPGDMHRTAQWPVRVIAVEPLGAETLLMLSLGDSGEELIARIGRDTSLKSGDRATITLDTTAVHLFDPVSTKALVWGS
ncbi:MAG: sn-glycerol-3-phosphate ABC transporter ATP-binding protein UgpC [Acidobacteria bacterium]|nr:sn-glycerol-3-phosphate ABC transporter ATP-binding protein UgpC [Acidobacteriota bacterium]